MTKPSVWLQDVTPPRRRNSRPEADHESEFVIPLYTSCGFHVNKTSARVWAKGVSQGIPDLHLQHVRLGFEMRHETKIVDEKGRCLHRQTPEQVMFMERCQHTATPYVLGDAGAAIQFLEWLGIVNDRRGTATVPAVVRSRAQWPSVDRLRATFADGEWYKTEAHRRAVWVFGWESSADALRHLVRQGKR